MGFPDSHKQNVTRLLRDDLESVSNDQDLTVDKAFIEVVLDYLGFSEERDYRNDHRSDGAGDRGIDFWDITDKGIHVFQFKATTDLKWVEDESQRCGSGSLADLPRIQTLLTSPETSLEKANEKVKEFIRRYKVALSRAKEDTSDNQSPELDVTLTFCSLSHGFTDQAQEEFEKISSQPNPIVNGLAVKFHYRTIFIGDLLQEKWREDNTAWRDQSGKKRDNVTIELVGGIISETKSCVFFAMARDLVRMFDDFGYQIFEPNVRCEIKRSAVNEAIRSSVGTQIGRREFKHLNNGITMICTGFAKKLKQDPQKIIVTQPGVINGLQTVKSLSDAYSNLPAPDRADFDKNCQVLVRIHQRDAVKDYRVLVKSTNNQNPMQQRNLRSNDSEQITFERLFAEFNWFYERKQGAWAAFQSNARLWGTLKGKRKSDFKVGKYARTIDNEQLG